MAEDLKWFNIRKGADKNPINFFTLGRLENKEAALERLNRIFTKGEPPVADLTGKEPVFLIEGISKDKKEYPLIISGEGNKRIAIIGP